MCTAAGLAVLPGLAPEEVVYVFTRSSEDPHGNCFFIIASSSHRVPALMVQVKHAAARTTVLTKRAVLRIRLRQWRVMRPSPRPLCRAAGASMRIALTAQASCIA